MYFYIQTIVKHKLYSISYIYKYDILTFLYVSYFPQKNTHVNFSKPYKYKQPQSLPLLLFFT